MFFGRARRLPPAGRSVLRVPVRAPTPARRAPVRRCSSAARSRVTLSSSVTRSRAMRSNSRRAFDRPRLHPLKFLGQLAAFVIQRQHILFLRLLLAAQMFQLLVESGDDPVRASASSLCAAVSFASAWSARAAAFRAIRVSAPAVRRRFSSAADRQPVITHAIAIRNQQCGNWVASCCATARSAAT